MADTKNEWDELRQNLGVVDNGGFVGKSVDELESENVRDPLTGLFNRKYLETKLGEIVDQNKPVTVMFLDIDYFKSINDDYGHSAGDAVLKGIAVILDGFRNERWGNGEDFVARYGGEEIAFVFNASLDKETAKKRAEEIREKMQQTKFKISKENEIERTVSIGVCVRNNETMEELLNEADKAMYKAKEAGRNCVIVAE